MGREARQHLNVSSDPNLAPIHGLLTRSPTPQPSPSIESHHNRARRAVALFRRTDHYSGPLFHPRDSS